MATRRDYDDEGAEFWPDEENPALRGMYLVGFGVDVPYVYRRRTAAERADPDTDGRYAEYSYWVPFGHPRTGRNGRQNCGPELLTSLLEVTGKLNDGSYTEAMANVQLAYLAKANWELPELPFIPYYATRKGDGLYIYRDSPHWFRVRFQGGWLKPGHHDLEDGPLDCFNPKLAPVVMSLLFDLNAGTLSEQDARLMIESHPHFDRDTGLATFTRTTTV